MITLSRAKELVQGMLDMADGDAAAVERAIVSAERMARRQSGYTVDHEDDYRIQLIALADLVARRRA